MNKPQFIVLGILEQLGQGSGYDIKQMYDLKKVDQWLDVKIGSIYHAIKQLHKDGYIHEVEKKQAGKYPEKTIYTVTEKGKNRFDLLQEKAFLGLFPDFYGFKLALKFNERRTKNEIKEYAKMAIKIIDEKLGSMAEHLNSLDSENHRFHYDAFFIKHEKHLFQAEKEWIQDAVRNIDLIIPVQK
ncbi:PadR family transcriptional regulator [Chengkuizengella axinellae]|uniref:PadR family transcriptional regulator n=1 Tax=Chengkuizengella axinellae TaxID=3064388 RepID=A0ABT9J5X7_9BACL|nr:PadR family transcriptional regulator [Chengkuizengella sp. 2205SS18-9]MDP5277031.1 PadR family transcriptional regulator [Chengkuizengella sp. 2205SS18-9]